jgi:hypothetical protein
VWLLQRRDSGLVLRGDVGFKRPEIVARLAHPPGRHVLGWITERPGPLLLRGLPAAAVPEARRWLEAEEVRWPPPRYTAPSITPLTSFCARMGYRKPRSTGAAACTALTMPW